MSDFWISGIPEHAPARLALRLRWRMIMAVRQFVEEFPIAKLAVTVTSEPKLGESLSESATNTDTSLYESINEKRDTLSLEDRASYFEATDPEYTFDRLILPAVTLNQIFRAVQIVTSYPQLFDKWNLRSIEPHPSSAISFHGPSGTGKTFAAHAIADRLGKKIIHARCSQLESKYHGEGPKNLDALFYAARSQQAVLFLDEAEALMSQRYEHISQGSEHAVNTMRSELFMCLDHFEGLAIFATNLVKSYDSAFHSRVRHIEFSLPDRVARMEIWRRHVPAELPLAEDVRIEELAAIADVTGRDIKNAVMEAAAEVSLSERSEITMADLTTAIEQVKTTRLKHEPKSE